MDVWPPETDLRRHFDLGQMMQVPKPALKTNKLKHHIKHLHPRIFVDHMRTSFQRLTVTCRSRRLLRSWDTCRRSSFSLLPVTWIFSWASLLSSAPSSGWS